MQSNFNVSNPKVLVMGGNPGRWSAVERKEDEKYTTGIESWVYAFNSDYVHILEANPKDIANYDIVIANSNFHNKYLPKLLSLQKNKPQNVKWVTLIEGDLSYYLKPNVFIKALLDSSDLINVINKYTLTFFKKLTNSKVEYIGIPYPVDSITQMAIQIEKRQRRLFICPWLLTRQNDYLAAKEIGLPYYGYEKRISRKLNTLLSNYKTYGSNSPNFNIEKAEKYYADKNLLIKTETTLKNYFEENRDSFIWLNLDDRFTWGRYVLDAAALQIPIITTKSTGHADDLFPYTCLEHEYDIVQAIELGKRLVEDIEFYRMVSSYPFGKMEHLKAEVIKNKLLSSLDY
ncbi:MAG: hypothetical protein ABSG15_11235 [FCB group bacterium]|jgi:hypothetical protein